MGRRIGWAVMCACLAATLLAAPARGEELERRIEQAPHLLGTGEDQPGRLGRIYWKRGPYYAGPGGQFTLHLGAEVQFDAIAYSDMDAEVEAAAGGTWDSGVQLRRSRVFLEGAFHDAYFRVRYNVAPGEGTSFQDLFFEWTGPNNWTDGRFPKIRVGQTMEPVGLEVVTGALWTTFLERAMVVNALAPRRNAGVLLYGNAARDRVSWSLGGYLVNEDRLSDFETGEGGAVTGRIAWRPWAPPGRDCCLLHLGLSGSARFDVEQVRYQARPETHLGPEIVDTGDLAADDVVLAGGEVAWLRDRLSLQGELLLAHVSRPAGPALDYWGGYASISYFLTPPCRNYRRERANFGRVTPVSDSIAFRGRCPGAWEIAGRCSYLDLDDADVDAGRVLNLTAGLNWYPTAHARVMLNYIYSIVDDAYGVAGADGTMSTVGLRLQFDL
ncbi:MAG: OprO/OprP family phosphate-selective porin [Planctomycetota bacterium]|jgi:phosphate-selective porin OprO/OprP